MVVGHTSDAGSTLLITDAGSVVTTNEINVGQAGFGIGALMIEAGGSLSDIDGFIARFASRSARPRSAAPARPGQIAAYSASATSAMAHWRLPTAASSPATLATSASAPNRPARSRQRHGSAWTNSSELYVGYEGTGTLAIESAGSVSIQRQYRWLFRRKWHGDVSSGLQWTSSSGMFVGNSGVGSLTITGGGDVSDDYAYIANAAESQGTVTVDGIGSTWTNDGQLYVGLGGSARSTSRTADRSPTLRSAQ